VTVGDATVVLEVVLLGEVGEDESLLQAAMESAVTRGRTMTALSGARQAVLSNGPALFIIDDRSVLLGVCGSSDSKRRTRR
jgi:hypothetical protein